jgi:hypothetical protein
LVLAPVVAVRGLLPRAKMNRNHGHYRLLQQIGKPKISPAPPRVFCSYIIFARILRSREGGACPTVPPVVPLEPRGAFCPQQPDDIRYLAARLRTNSGHGERRNRECRSEECRQHQHESTAPGGITRHPSLAGPPTPAAARKEKLSAKAARRNNAREKHSNPERSTAIGGTAASSVRQEGGMPRS